MLRLPSFVALIGLAACTIVREVPPCSEDPLQARCASAATSAEVCGNGLDDDANGRTDCQDPQCDGACPEQCADGRDNDGDGDVDCADADCSCTEGEDCANLRDDDGDGLVDCLDPDCDCPVDTSTPEEECSNGLDDDADGYIDCFDQDCAGPSCPEDCADRLDNDANGLTDCEDPACVGQCGEVCDDGADNDSDGYIDCRDQDCWSSCSEACFNGFDDDGDGYTDCLDQDCLPECDLDEDGFTSSLGGGPDCDDDNPAIHPGAPEACNGLDDDCDGLLDHHDPDLDPSVLLDGFEDLDGDGFGRPGRLRVCPDRLVANDNDCDDDDPAVNPRATEVCNGIDDDCNGRTDVWDPGLDVSTAVRQWLDVDGDGFGALVKFYDYQEKCSLEPAHAIRDGDCDPLNFNILGAGRWRRDRDGDGYGSGSLGGIHGCDPPGPGWVSEHLPEDCDDDNPNIHPHAREVCTDGVDWNCDGTPACTAKVWAPFITDWTGGVPPPFPPEDPVAVLSWRDPILPGWTDYTTGNSPHYKIGYLSEWRRCDPYLQAVDGLSAAPPQTPTWQPVAMAGLQYVLDEESSFAYCATDLGTGYDASLYGPDFEWSKGNTILVFNHINGHALGALVPLNPPFHTHFFRQQRLSKYDAVYPLETIVPFRVGAATWDRYNQRFLLVNGEALTDHHDCSFRNNTQFWSMDPITYETELLFEEEPYFNEAGVAVDPDRGIVWRRGTACRDGELQFTIATYDPAAGWARTIVEEEPVPEDWFRWEDVHYGGAPIGIEFLDFP